MSNFETTLLISPDLTKNNLDNVGKTFEKLINEQGGSIVEKEDWGLRDLAYSIKNQKKAFYFFYQIKINSDKIQLLKKNLTLNENIVRHLIVKVYKHDKLPTKILESMEK